MKMKRLVSVAMSLAMLLAVSSVASFAVTRVSGERMSAQMSKPSVVIIRADWCTACQKLEPTMMELMKEYDGKLNFVVLDVTNDETTAAAKAKAESLGLGAFFEANKKMTSTVAVFKGKKTVFKTSKNYDRAAYVSAFDKAIG